jgi:hypothetical protein
VTHGTREVDDGVDATIEEARADGGGSARRRLLADQHDESADGRRYRGLDD